MLPLTPFSLPYLIEIFIVRQCAAIYYIAVGLEKSNREQTDRESNYRGHSNRGWIVGLSRPILYLQNSTNKSK